MFKTSFEELFANNSVKTLTAYQVVMDVATTPDGFELIGSLPESGEVKLDLQIAAVSKFVRMDSRLERFSAQDVFSAVMKVHNKLQKADAKKQGHNNFCHLDGRGVFKDQLMLEHKKLVEEAA